MHRSSRSATSPSFELPCLQRVLSAELIAQALAEYDRQGKRRRLLPPPVVFWLVVGMGLFRSLNVQVVLGRVRDSLSDAVGWGPAEPPHTTSITQARDRLGWRVVRAIFEKLAELLSGRHAQADTWLGLRVFALDGTTFLATDTAANEAEFGRAGASRGGKSAFPQLRAVALMGAWTHLLAAASVAPYRTSELALAEEILDRVKAGMLLLLDRAYYSFGWLAALRRREAHFVVRLKKGRCALNPTKRRRLGPHDTEAVLPIPKYLRRRDRTLPDELRVRLVTLRRKGFRPITLVTSLLDPTAHPAQDVAELYLDRWEVELGYRELKIHLRDEKAIFRSHRPDRVRQEAYGLLIAYNCVRALMAEAAEVAGVRPIELSFTGCLERIRAALTCMAVAEVPINADRLLDALGRCRLQKRRPGRRYDRAVKRKMSSYPRKRTGQRAATSRSRRRRQRQTSRGARLAP